MLFDNAVIEQCFSQISDDIYIHIYIKAYKSSKRLDEQKWNTGHSSFWEQFLQHLLQKQ